MGAVLTAVLESAAGDPVDDPAVVVVTGSLDVRTAPHLRQQLVELAAAGRPHVVVDLDGVDFLDATGLGVLVGGLRRVRPHGGSLRLVCSRPSILGALAVVGVARMLPVYPSLSTALSTAVAA